MEKLFFGNKKPAAATTAAADAATTDASGTSAATSSTAPPRPWVEKYRPKRLSDVESQDEAVAALSRCLSAGANMPHLLFYGPAGTGKTSSILAAAFELFGPDLLRDRVKELNASDDRGISVVREKVKLFAQGSVGGAGLANKVQSDGNTYPVPPFKLIILDEADALLPDAQAALRRMMEDFSEVTRFCILCNYVSRIIDPITSRCAKFRFKPLSAECTGRRIRLVAEREGLLVSDDTIRHLSAASGGDLRLAIMHLQSAARAHGTDLTKEDFVAVAGLVPVEEMRIYTALLCNPHAPFNVLYEATKGLVQKGFSATTVVQQLHLFLVSPEAAAAFSDVQRAQLCLHLATCERAMLDRGDDLLQLSAFAARVHEVKARKDAIPPQLRVA